MTEPLRVAITIDVEHDCPPFMQSCRGMEEGMPRLLDLFAADSIPVTFFTTGDMARRFPQIVERIVGDGHELGCHGDTHKRFSAMLPDEAQREIESASATLRRSTEVVSFRAPNLDLPEAYLPLLSAAGYAVDSSRGRHKLTHRTFKRAIRDPPRQGLGLSGALRAADKSDYVTLRILYVTSIPSALRCRSASPARSRTPSWTCWAPRACWWCWKPSTTA